MRTIAPVCLLLGALLGGCVSTTLRAVKDPAYAAKVYQALLIRSFETHDPERRMMFEDGYADQLRRQGFTGTLVKFYEVFPPTRTPDEAAVAKAVRARGLDGILELRATSIGATSSYVPRSSTTTTTGDRGKGSGKVELRSTTTESGGYTVYTPYMRFEIRLVDVARGDTAWVGYTTTTGGSAANYQPLIDSQAGAVVQRMFSDGVIQRR